METGVSGLILHVKLLKWCGFAMFVLSTYPPRPPPVKDGRFTQGGDTPIPIPKVGREWIIFQGKHFLED